jgi:hypothetical protein
MRMVIHLQFPTVFSIDGRITSFYFFYVTHEVNNVRLTEVHAAEPLVPGKSYFMVENTVGKS